MEAPRRLSTPYPVRTRSVPGPYQVRIYNYGEGTEKLRKKPFLIQKLYKFLCPLA